jgi:glycosyltransferase involved in cell wall biosynthesis
MRLRVPSVVSLCGGELAAVAEIGYGGGSSRGGRLLARTALALPMATTAATGWIRGHAMSAGARIDELVPLGADRRRFTPGERPDDGAHIVQVASLNAVKDQFLALDAFARLLAVRPDATLALVGVDTMSGAHAAYAAKLGVARSVRLTGFVQPDEVAAVYRSATVHLNTSWHEAGPLAVLEAAMCGVPTVGTRVGHVADLAALPKPAAVAVDHDPDAVAAGVLRLLTDPTERGAIAARAATWANAHDADHTAAAYTAIYRRLTARSSRTRAASSGEVPRVNR